jgi:hypothetical protein
MVNLFNRSTAAQWLLSTLSLPSGNSTEAAQSKNTAAECSCECLSSIIAARAGRGGLSDCIYHMQAVLHLITEPKQFTPVSRKEPHCLLVVLRRRHFLQRLGYPAMCSASRQPTRVWSTQDSSRRRLGEWTATLPHTAVHPCIMWESHTGSSWYLSGPLDRVLEPRVW